MNWWILLVSAVAGWLRGTKEGMVMIKHRDTHFDNMFEEGVRGHEWFRWYHAISVAVIASFMLLGVQWWHNPHMIPLSLFMIWEAYETAYPYSRWGVFINQYPEHITFVDLVSLHYHSKWLHLFRISFIVALVWRML